MGSGCGSLAAGVMAGHIDSEHYVAEEWHPTGESLFAAIVIHRDPDRRVKPAAALLHGMVSHYPCLIPRQHFIQSPHKSVRTKSSYSFLKCAFPDTVLDNNEK